MLLDANRPWRHRALIPLRLTEAKGMYVAKVTSKTVTVYMPDQDDPNKVKKVKIAHTSVPAYADKVVDPPPGETPVGYIPDPAKHKGSMMVKPYKPDQPTTGKTAPETAKAAKFVPVYNWNDKTVFVWMKKSGSQPMLVEVPHKKVQGYAKRLGWTSAKVKLVGKINPYEYNSPEDIYPLDWDPGDGKPDFVPSEQHAVSQVFQPEYDDDKKLTVEPEQLTLKPKVDQGVPSLQIPDEFEYLKTKDSNGLAQVKHKGSGLTYSVLANGAIAYWDEGAEKYFPLKKTASGWAFDHDAPLVDPEGAEKAESTADDAPSGTDYDKGYTRAGEDENGFPAYNIDDPNLFPPDAVEAGNIVWLPSGEFAYLEAGHYRTIDWDEEDVLWWEGDNEYTVNEALKLKKGKTAPALPGGFKLPGDDFEVKTVAKGYVTVETPDGLMIKWDAAKNTWFYMDEPWKEWTPGGVDAPPSAKTEDPLPSWAKAPPGFELGSSVNKHGAVGLSSDKYWDDGNWFLLPGGKLAHYDAYKGAYQLYDYTATGFTTSTTSKVSSIPAKAVKMLQSYAEPLPVPDGYSLAGYDLNGLPQASVGPGTKKFTLLPNGQLAAWSSSKNLYKTQAGVKLTLDQIESGDYGPSVAKVEIADEPEEGAHQTTFLDKLDSNGYPMVDEVDPDDPDSPYVEKDLTLLPDERVARWSSHGFYSVYKWDSNDGYIKTHQTLAVDEVSRLLQAFSLVVKNYRYYKATGLHAEKPPEQSAYPGFELMTPTESEKGLVPGNHIETGVTYYLLPGLRAARLDQLYDIGPGGKLTPVSPALSFPLTHDVLRLLTQGYDPEPPLGMKWLQGSKAFDPHGFPKAVDDDNEHLTVLPSGIVARWDSEMKKYEVFIYDSSFQAYLPSPKEKTYTVKQALKLKKSQLKQKAKVPVPSQVSPKIAPPAPDKPATPENPYVDGKLVPLGEKDVNGYDLYTYTFDMKLSKIPVVMDDEAGSWSPVKNAYRVRKYDAGSNSYIQKFSGMMPVWWVPGEPAVFIGKNPKAKSSATLPLWAWEDTGTKDPNGFSIVYLKKNGKILDTFVQLPKGKTDGDVGKWFEDEEDGIKGYAVYKIVNNPEPGKWIVMATPEVWDPTDQPEEPEEESEVDAKQAHKDAAEAEQPSDASSSTLIADLAGKLPDIDTLTYEGDGAFLGGAGQKSIFSDPTTGLKFIFKPAIAKSGGKVEAFRAHAQEAFAAIAARVRADHIPIKTVKYKGKLGTLQPIIDLDSEQPHLKAAGGMKPEQLTPEQLTDVATEHLLSWLMSQHDDHRGNLLKTKDGRIISVDKEQGWKYFKDDKLDVDYHPNGQYGEEEPFYNKFWKAFANGSINFDPMKMKKPLESLEAMPSEEFSSLLRTYAKAVHAGKEIDQDRFIIKALKRKLHLRKDFEKFITKLYIQRTGEPGAFSFSEGWLTHSDKKSQKYKKVEFKAKDLISNPQEAAAAFGIEIKVKPYKYVGPEGTFEDPAKLTLKISMGASETKLMEFLDKLGLKPIPFPNGDLTMAGQAYFMVSVDKAAFEAASITKEVLITEAFGSTPAAPRYWPDLPDPPQMTPSLTKDLTDLDTKKIGREGHAMLSDGTGVEGQAAKAKRWKDSKGTYFFLTLKLRPKFWKKIRDSDLTKPGTFTFKQAEYDSETDSFVEQPGSIASISEGVSWDFNGSECFLATGEHQYAYMGQVYMKLRGVSGSQTLSTARAALDYAASGVGKEIFRDPTPEDRKVMKMMRLLWAKSPKTAHALSEEERTVDNLTEIFKKKKIKKSDLAAIEEQEVLKGYHSHVLPGRWKKMKDVKFLFNGISSQEAALSIMKSGLMSIHERNLTGIPKFGGSYDADVESGSGDGTLLRVICGSGLQYRFDSHNFHGKFQAIVHPDVLDRLDTYMYNSDSFGRCKGSSFKSRSSVEARVSQVAKAHRVQNEISFRKGLHRSKIIRLATSNETYRKSLITAARDQGTTEVNGVPIEDFVVVVTNCGDAYNRYVKPLLGVS